MPGIKLLPVLLMLLCCSNCSYAQERGQKHSSLEELKKLEQELDEKQFSVQRERYVLIGSAVLLLLGMGIYLKLRQQDEKEQRAELENTIDKLKAKLRAQSFSSTQSNEGLKLDKEKIEKAINAKLGDSSWMILNLIFQNPSISNKEIANEVSLSLEGVSSSLRRMYSAFNIISASNKKITLLMEAVRTSFEE